MFTITIGKAEAICGDKITLTSGMVKAVRVAFVFSEEWDNFDKIVVFSNGTETLDVSLGEDNTALCFLGGDTGKMLESMLISKGQKYECIEVPSPTRVNVKIAELTEDQKTFEFNAKGGKISKEHADLLLSSLEKLTENDIVILSGSTPPSDVDLYGVTEEFALSRGACVICDSLAYSKRPDNSREVCPD